MATAASLSGHTASVSVCFAKAMTSYKIPTCQIRLLEQSAIKAFTCSGRKLALTAMEGANEASEGERYPETGGGTCEGNMGVCEGRGSARTADQAAGTLVDTCR